MIDVPTIFQKTTLSQMHQEAMFKDKQSFKLSLTNKITHPITDKKRIQIIPNISNQVRTITMMRRKVKKVMVKLNNKKWVELRGPLKDRKSISRSRAMKKINKKIQKVMMNLKIVQSNLLEVEDQEEDLKNHQI